MRFKKGQRVLEIKPFFPISPERNLFSTKVLDATPQINNWVSKNGFDTRIVEEFEGTTAKFKIVILKLIIATNEPI
jgi:hypothetical protein